MFYEKVVDSFIAILDLPECSFEKLYLWTFDKSFYEIFA